MAYDDVVQAMSGLVSITGTQESGPVMTGSPIIDYATGLMAAFAISAAISRQVRTGEGEILDVAIEREGVEITLAQNRRESRLQADIPIVSRSKPKKSVNG